MSMHDEPWHVPPQQQSSTVNICTYQNTVRVSGGSFKFATIYGNAADAHNLYLRI
jgi:hypothetical protein